MALYTKIDVDCQVAGDSGLTSVKGALIVDSVTGNKFLVESSARLSLAAAASDVAFDFQDVVTGQFILIESESEVTVKFNGTGNGPIILKPTSDEDGTAINGFLILQGSGITSLHFGNPGASTAVVDVIVAGLAS